MNRSPIFDASVIVEYDLHWRVGVVRVGIGAEDVPWDIFSMVHERNDVLLVLVPVILDRGLD